MCTVIDIKRFIKCLLITLLSLAVAILGSFSTYAIIQSQKGTFVPIIMYHSILKDESRQGDYILSPIELEKDIIYLLDKGYTPIICEDLVSYVYSDKELPKKPIILTFDDGSLNNMTYVLPLLNKYNIKAVFSVVGEFCDNEEKRIDKNINYSYMTWEDTKNAYLTGKVEIACHSYNFHSIGERRGVLRKDNESYSEYRSVFLADTLKYINTIKKKSEIVPVTYAYPYGFSTEENTPLIKACGFKVSLDTEEKPNYIKKDKDSLFNLHRYNRQSAIDTESFMSKVLSH